MVYTFLLKTLNVYHAPPSGAICQSFVKSTMPESMIQAFDMLIKFTHIIFHCRSSFLFVVMRGTPAAKEERRTLEIHVSQEAPLRTLKET